jgi:DNA-binding MarR family transcriptional regulator
VTREFDAADRRRVTLALTAHAATQAYLAEVLSALSLTEQQVVAQAMPRFFASNGCCPTFGKWDNSNGEV